LLGHARWRLWLRDGSARQQTEQTDKQCVRAANHALCRPDSHLHAGILLDRTEMMPQR
jgi:hypothetical protein